MYTDQMSRDQFDRKAAEAAPFKVRRIPEFSSTSRNGQKCSLSGGGQALDGPGRQPHEVDEFILRGPAIQSEGFFDFRPSVLRALALEFTDLVPPPTQEAMEAELELELEARELRSRLNELEDELESAYRALARATARFSDEEPEVEGSVFFDNPEDLQDDEEE